ncbi:hypothetical protein IJ707_07115 [bacterium]|nr:hypothetical protein [bacterium]
MLEPDTIKDLYDIDADYWDMYEYLYEVHIELIKIHAYLSIKPDCLKYCKKDCFQNSRQARKIIQKTVKRIGKIITPWIDFMNAYSDDLQFGIKKKY